MPKTTRKEYFTSVRIKAIYILKEKKLAKKIKEAIRVSKTRTYILVIIAKERK
jgi:hypothetical protein